MTLAQVQRELAEWKRLARRWEARSKAWQTRFLKQKARADALDAMLAGEASLRVRAFEAAWDAFFAAYGLGPDDPVTGPGNGPAPRAGGLNLEQTTTTVFKDLRTVSA